MEANPTKDHNGVMLVSVMRGLYPHALQFCVDLGHFGRREAIQFLEMCRWLMESDDGEKQDATTPGEDTTAGAAASH
jgi:hypothetical protein